MATYDLTQAELSAAISGNLDASVRDFVLNFLFDEDSSGSDDGPGNSEFGRSHMPGSPGNSEFGLGHNQAPDTITVQISDTFEPLNPQADALVLNNAHGTVEAKGQLDAIIQNVSGDSDLRVTGNQDLLVATGTGDNFVDMQGAAGDDIVLTGSGNDTINDGKGNDTILGGAGNDFIDGGEGEEQLFDGEAGRDTIFGGDGNFDTVSGGDGNDSLVGGDGDNQLLTGGTGADTIFGGDGASNTLSGGDGADQIAMGDGEDQFADGGAGSDTIWAGEGGGNTLFGGTGDDTFNVTPDAGDSTIVGGGGNNTIDFGDLASTDVEIGDTIAGQTTITFNDSGETLTVSEIQDLVFTDGTQHLP
jgi:Ca2+-binding RTX toxin-like protein